MDVLMPQLGETVAEGKITQWFKNAGDPVQPGDNLFEIETDKTTMEVPAIFAGTLSIINFRESNAQVHSRHEHRLLHHLKGAQHV